jgi:hypothetical protein
VTEFSKTFLVFYKWLNLVHSKVCLVIFLCCEHAAWYLLFLSLFGFTSQQYTSNTKICFFKVFSRPGRAENRSRGDSQTKDRKTPKTRWKRFYFRNGLGTGPGVYGATTIAVTTVGGTCGVLKTSFWPNITSAHPIFKVSVAAGRANR